MILDALVTGASGFLGRRLVARLRADGRRVRVFVRKPPCWLRDDPGVDVAIGDLRDSRSVQQAATDIGSVYHLGAAMSGPASEYEHSTVDGTRNVIAACTTSDVRRLVYVSSLAVLDHAGRDTRKVITESSMVEPHPERRGAYTRAKIAAERLVLEAVAGRGLRAALIRPGQIFGPGAERTTPNATIAVAGRWVAVGPATQALPLVYVDDVVDALILAEQQPGIDGRIFHVVDPDSISHGEYLARCRRKLGRDPRMIRLPMLCLEFIAAANELIGAVRNRPIAVTRYRVQSLRPLSNFDLKAATTQLGWHPRIGVKEGLRRTFD